MRLLTKNTLVFRAHSSSRYSVAALLGAIEIDERLTNLDVKAPINDYQDVISNSIRHGVCIVAYSVMSTQTHRVQHEVSVLRQEYGKQLILVGGGPHASARPRDLLNWGFDYVIIGEGERTFPDLVHRLVTRDDPAGIEGVVSNIRENYPRPKDLSQIKLDNYPPFAIEMNVVGPIEVTRGCPFSCKFCCTPYLTGGRVRHRSIENVLYWVDRAVRERGFRRTWFLSPNALCYGGHGRSVELDKLERLVRGVSGINGLEEVYFGAFPSEVRPEFVSKKALEILRQYVANKTIQIGVQSGSDKVLEISNRHHTVAEGINGVQVALECGFIPHVDIIFGLPGEREDDLRASIDLCYELVDMGAKVHGHVFMPLPGSAFENMPPGRLDEESRKHLGELSRKGVLTGSWAQQEILADELAQKNDI